MFFNVFSRAILCAGLVALTACGGGEPAGNETITVPVRSNSAVQQTPATPIIDSNPVRDAAVRSAPVVSPAEREAEQLRMVPYEQAFSIEMRRRAQERPEHLREQGAAGALQAQPACDGAPDPARPAECGAAQPGATAAPPGQAL
ncbi:hypothetical protein INH39_20435 [Massilia violaceinigra]|uniref:Uncharacterized protein n=1 Tax=Massilia violaceinigra TaxID=2045208 RepID=A0ABY3ZZE5_9BURK|nr:hypothetical protein [Massilia violaceinigra]UOD27846.1 hypothetical protein INH39_20435 [Massilia violaceinigra]